MPTYGKKPIGSVMWMAGVIAVPTPFATALVKMVEYNFDYLFQPGESVFYHPITTSYHPFARNCMVDQMQGEWLQMLDTDHTHDPDLTARLLALMNRHQIDVLSAMYVYRNPPHNPVMFIRRPTGELAFLGDWDRRRRLEVM